MSTKTPNRIRWEAGAEAVSTAWFGHAGAIDACLFQILKPVLDDDGFILITHLPGCGGELTRENDDDEALKAEAERWLEEFVSSLGAVWPDEAGNRRAEVLRRFAPPQPSSAPGGAGKE